MLNREFYNSLASDYDQMINFSQSVKNKTEYLKHFILPEYNYALDLGCGSGADSIALSKLGLTVDAVDHSEKMIKTAEENSANFKADINFIFSELSNYKEQRKYDFIVSLSNTLANITEEDLKKLFNNFTFLLKKEGKILIQLINFAKLPNNGAYHLNMFENDEVRISRDYQISEKNIDFIITIKDKRSMEARRSKQKFFPILKINLNF
jgi:ubiquinone/menaquinone biosynthesis C-methylase UbiE